MGNKKKEPTAPMEKDKDARTRYDNIRIEERKANLNKLTIAKYGVPALEFFTDTPMDNEVQLEYEANDRGIISPQEREKFKLLCKNKLGFSTAVWNRLRQGSFPQNSDARSRIADAFDMNTFYDFMIYTNYGEPKNYPCSPDYSTSAVKEFLEYTKQNCLYTYSDSDICKYLNIKLEEWHAALKDENNICFAFAEYLEQYFDLVPGKLTNSVKKYIIQLRGYDKIENFTPDMLTDEDIEWYTNVFHCKTHIFSMPPIPQKIYNDRELKEWQKCKDFINKNGYCVVIHNIFDEPIILRNFDLAKPIIDAISQSDLRKYVLASLNEDRLNEGVKSTLFKQENQNPNK